MIWDVFLEDDEGFHQQIGPRSHWQDSHFYFPQRQSSLLPLVVGFTFKVRLPGLGRAHSCGEVTDDSVNYPECKGNLAHL